MIKAYKILLSNKAEIKIDEDEIDAALNAIATGSVGKMRQGIFNPSFLVAIIEDEDRLERLHEAIRLAEKHNELFPDKQRPLPEGFKKLEDIFSGRKQLS